MLTSSHLLLLFLLAQMPLVTEHLLLAKLLAEVLSGLQLMLFGALAACSTTFATAGIANASCLAVAGRAAVTAASRVVIAAA
jgi:hypothetical protein